MRTRVTIIALLAGLFLVGCAGPTRRSRGQSCGDGKLWICSDVTVTATRQR